MFVLLYSRQQMGGVARLRASRADPVMLGGSSTPSRYNSTTNRGYHGSTGVSSSPAYFGSPPYSVYRSPGALQQQETRMVIDLDTDTVHMQHTF